MSLQRPVITFKPEGVEVRTLYRSEDGPNPGTKGRVREATGLARSGLTAATGFHTSARSRSAFLHPKLLSSVASINLVASLS